MSLKLIAPQVQAYPGKTQLEVIEASDTRGTRVVKRRRNKVVAWIYRLDAALADMLAMAFTKKTVDISLARTKAEAFSDSLVNAFSQGAFGGASVVFADTDGTVRVQTHTREHLDAPISYWSANKIVEELEADAAIRRNGRMTPTELKHWKYDRDEKKRIAAELEG